MKNFLRVLIIFTIINAFLACYNHQKSTVEDIMQRLKARVDSAVSKDTFAVGGIMIDNRNGNIIYENQNRVTGWLESGELFFRNPTNHGERQAISWYWANKDRLGLPEPQNITIISSLDPCMMCTGSILASGFNVGSIDLDSGEGVNYQNIKFDRFSDKLKTKLQQTFGYYKVNGSQKRSEYFGGNNVYFKEQSVSSQLLTHLDNKFDESIIKVGKVEAESSFISFKQLKNIKDLNQQRSRAIIRLRQIDPNALSVKFLDIKSHGNIVLLSNLLSNLVQKTPKAENAVAMIDPFGNLLLAQPDTFQASPINSAIFNIANKYYNFYFQQISSASATTVGGYKQSQAYQYFASPRDCTFIFLKAPAGDDFISLQIFAIMKLLSQKNEEPLLYYLNDPIRGSIEHTKQLLESFPPLYKEYYKNKPLIKLKANQETDL